MLSCVEIAVTLAIHGIVNTISTRILAWISTFSAAWHFFGSMILAVLIPCVAPTHQDASFVFLDFQGVDVTSSEFSSPPPFLPALLCRPAMHQY